MSVRYEDLVLAEHRYKTDAFMQILVKDMLELYKGYFASVSVVESACIIFVKKWAEHERAKEAERTKY